jgi:hypothetical protein
VVVVEQVASGNTEESPLMLLLREEEVPIIQQIFLSTVSEEIQPSTPQSEEPLFPGVLAGLKPHR